MFEYADRTALITGASSGIGASFARKLAARRMNLVLVARNADRLNALADELRARHRIDVMMLPLDLSDPDAISQIEAALAEHGVTVDLLVNDAGFGTNGAFVEIEPAREREEILVNVLAVVELCHLLTPGMIARGYGAIVNVASNTAFQPVPYMAVYAATKSFVLSFSQALHVELARSNVRVLGLCPGPTSTEFFSNAKADRLGRMASATMRTPSQVVDTALKALDANRSSVVDGAIFSAAAVFGKLIPPSWQARMIGRALHPSTKD